ncbi:uncharacterized protein LOC119072930 [Bradysia coprophila]|uniref:uncharacterized protein LOC119072930 n=1 Tax=Bradysia coprophila TaxID=38358 RepID=UPI00187DC03A|nr:uncharacterized protein LOC119072930 [Bradysia coprophila]
MGNQHVTPDLKREFSIGKKKKEIQLFKHEKAKARVMRKKLGRIAKSSSFGVTLTPIIVSSITRTAEVRVTTTPTEYDKKNGTSSVTMSVKCEPQIPEWSTPKEDSQESDATMSETSSEFDESDVEVTKEDNFECDTFMPSASSKSGESEGYDATMPETSSELDESDVEVTKCTTPKEDNVECDTFMSSASSKSGESEEYDATMSETSSVCDESEIEAPKFTAPKQNNVGCDTPTSVVPSEFDEAGIEVDEKNISPSENDENGPLVSVALSSDCSTETTRRESGHSSVMSMTLVAESESDVDSFEKQHQRKEWLLGFNEQLEPVFESAVESFERQHQPKK